MTNYLLIGNGRLARHFREYFRLLGDDQSVNLRAGFDVQTWSRQENSPSQLTPLIEWADRVLLMISDSNLQQFVDSNRQRGDQVWIHFSGALEVKNAESFHPLMTFGPELYSLEKYRRVPFVTTSGLSLHEALPGLSNDCFAISKTHKARYHALCVLSGNFSTILWQKIISEFRHWGLPAGLAHEYALQGVENVFRDPENALTGPLVRGDLATQESNLKALEGDAFQDVYLSFQKVFSRSNQSRLLSPARENGAEVL